VLIPFIDEVRAACTACCVRLCMPLPPVQTALISAIDSVPPTNFTPAERARNARCGDMYPPDPAVGTHARAAANAAAAPLHRRNSEPAAWALLRSVIG
jgi:hypothetical protein